MHSQQKSFNGSAKILAFSFVLMTACCVAFKSSRTVLIVNALRASMDDPNFESHLPSLLKVGLSERPDYDLAQSLRSRFKKIENIKRQAADVLKTQNNELAVELMEMADEIEETTDKFVALAETWDAWSRSDPELPQQLRFQNKGLENDPNFVEHLPQMMNAGKSERPSYDLPSELRLLKFKNTASVKRLASTELKKTSENSELAIELDEIADEIEEAHMRFVEMTTSLKARQIMSDNSKTTR